MNGPWNAPTGRAIARGIQIGALASCLAAGTGIGRSGAHAAPLAGPSVPFCATRHYLTGASAHYSVLRVNGACFPYPSSVHIVIADLTTGTMLQPGITIPVTSLIPPNPWSGRFQYVTQGDARPGDAIRCWIVDGAWHRILTTTDTP